MKKHPSVTIYTDGACSGNPGPGGWACVLLYEDHRKELSGGSESTTNNRMELTAAVKGLSALKISCHVELYSDSAYLVNAFNEAWIKSWKLKNWKNSAGKEVRNKDLWMMLDELSGKHDVKWHKVKAHADDELNNRCDELAVGEIKLLREKKNL